MTAGGITPIPPLAAIDPAHAAAATAGIPTAQDPALDALEQARQQQVFSQLMENTNSTLLTQSMKPPRSEDEDD